MMILDLIFGYTITSAPLSCQSRLSLCETQAAQHWSVMWWAHSAGNRTLKRLGARADATIALCWRWQVNSTAASRDNGVARDESEKCMDWQSGWGGGNQFVVLYMQMCVCVCVYIIRINALFTLIGKFANFACASAAMQMMSAFFSLPAL